MKFLDKVRTNDSASSKPHVKTRLRGYYRTALAVLFGACLLMVGSYAQSAGNPGRANTHTKVLQDGSPLRFEVVSIKPSRPHSEPSFSAETTASGYRTTQQSLWATIMLAYFPEHISQWRNEQLVGAPSWLSTDLYDIDARVSASDITQWQQQGQQRKQLALMLQTMLAERCQLRVHHVVQKGHVIALRSNTPLLKLKEAVPRAGAPTGTVPLPTGGYMLPGRDSITFFSTSMASLSAFLSHSSDWPVHDETGSTKTYDFVLSRTQPGDSSTDDGLSSSSWDLHRLGLVLTPVKGDQDVVVIDHVTKPSAN